MLKYFNFFQVLAMVLEEELEVVSVGVLAAVLAAVSEAALEVDMEAVLEVDMEVVLAEELVVVLEEVFPPATAHQENLAPTKITKYLGNG